MDRAAATTLLAAASGLLGLVISLAPAAIQHRPVSRFSLQFYRLRSMLSGRENLVSFVSTPDDTREAAHPLESSSATPPHPRAAGLRFRHPRRSCRIHRRPAHDQPLVRWRLDHPQPDSIRRP